MTRILRPAAAAVTLAGGLGSVGCFTTGHPYQGGPIEAHYDNLVDRCWPERYAYHARQNVIAPFAVQVGNAAVLDSTLWNWMFYQGTDKLHPAGLEKLDYLARRRPAPDGVVYIQTSRDIPYDAAEPDKFLAARQELDAKRGQAVLRYLTASTAPRPLAFTVQTIDPAEPAQPVAGPANAVRGLSTQYRSGITGVGGGGDSVTGVGGGAPGGAPAGPGGGGAASPAQ